MADIEIVIKIDEEDYTFFKEGYSHLKIKEHLTDTLDHRCCIAIANGIPLPKGHGKLIDVDWMLNKMATTDAQPRTQNEYYAWDFAKTLLKLAPTIIEADSEKE